VSKICDVAAVADYLGRSLLRDDDDDQADRAGLDDGDAVEPSVPLFRNGPEASVLRPIDTSLHTGTAAVDALAPIGRGQV
jgi:F0F1-type ATP synthase alpha subunit